MLRSEYVYSRYYYYVVDITADGGDLIIVAQRMKYSYHVISKKQILS